MGAIWTADMRARQSAAACRLWQERVRNNPHAHKLARARGLRDLSQRDVAALARIDVRTLSEIENGSTPSQPTRERLARVLCLPESELFDD